VFVYRNNLIGFENCQTFDSLFLGNKRTYNYENISLKVVNINSAPDADINALIQAFNQGEYLSALQLASDMTQSYPKFPFGWKAFGASLQKKGNLEQAIIAMETALELQPNDAEAHTNLGNILEDLGRLPDAERSHRHSIKLRPTSAVAHFNLGTTLNSLGLLAEAEGSFREAIRLQTNFADAFCNLGNVLKDLRRYSEAEKSYLEAIAIRPNFYEAHYNLSKTLIDLGRLSEAEASCRQSISLKSDFVAAYFNLGNILGYLKRYSEAEAIFRRTISLKPNFAEAHNNLGNILKDLGRESDAVECFRQAIAIKPELAECHNNLGSSLKNLGFLSEAELSFRQAMYLKPEFDAANSNLLFLHAYHSLSSVSEYLSMAKAWETNTLTLESRADALNRRFKRKPLHARKLKIGYISGDFLKHAVSHFVEQLFAQHDRSRVELFAYSTNRQTDSTTERIKSHVQHWVSIVDLSECSIRNQIQMDEIDILIDLSGHTANNRMRVFAMRAAPVQVHYLGYMGSTGLSEMDYWIGDQILTPPETDHHYSEAVWRLPRTWVCYGGKKDLPYSKWHPSLDGTVWIGSFNGLGKLTPQTLKLWATILHALPKARLLLKNKSFRDKFNRDRVLIAMEEHGVFSDRIELQDGNTTPDWNSHMSYYDRLDIALDPVGGMGGGTTTCDALWMGVPVVTLLGKTMGQRMTSSMLNAIGQADWIAETENDYVTKVVNLANDVKLRNDLRFKQRNKMAHSDLCDAADLAKSLEDAYEAMFNSWFNKFDENYSNS
jgi:protein O-GlcNAc transferase